jgi:hypothetical protein
MSEEANQAESRTDQLRVVRKGQSRYLVNGTDTPIERLQYSTAAFGENYVSSVPTYEIESIPARSGAEIEDVDPHEEGLLLWQVGEVDWGDGTEYRGTKKLTEAKRASVEWHAVEREKRQIGEPNPPQIIDDEDEE